MLADIGALSQELSPGLCSQGRHEVEGQLQWDNMGHHSPGQTEEPKMTPPSPVGQLVASLESDEGAPHPP